MRQHKYVIGVDFGTDSVRSVLVDTTNGEDIAASVFTYPRWRDQLYCKATVNQFRQHPLDYIEGLEHTIKECLKLCGYKVASHVVAISVDTTGSTPAAVNEDGVPLALTSGFSENPNAMFVLWKDHTAVLEAAEINEYASRISPDYLSYVGGTYSSEWFWAKLLHILRSDDKVRKAAWSWVEHCDWIPFLLTGGKKAASIRRGICAAGHKSLYADAFGGLPPETFFAGLDPILKGFRTRMSGEVYTSDKEAGTISSEWASRLGLPETVLIGVGAFDAHMGAVGGQIEPYFLSKVMGTSTCDMLVAPLKEMDGKLVHGICGQVPGSIIPGMLGMEAGQSAFGDTFAWFRNLLAWPLENLPVAAAHTGDRMDLIKHTSTELIAELSRHAAEIPIDEDSELALDWLNGRRTPDANQSLKAAIAGLNLASNAPAVFRALTESICFGARQIVERFRQQGVPVKGLIGLGGVSRKSPFTMQMLSDIMGMPLKVHRSEQTCAMGAAMFAATVAGIYPRVEDAMQALGQGFDLHYTPNKSLQSLYERRFEKFTRLGNFIQESTPV